MLCDVKCMSGMGLRSISEGVRSGFGMFPFHLVVNTNPRCLICAQAQEIPIAINNAFQVMSGKKTLEEVSVRKKVSREEGSYISYDV
jgi:hypothetical protein